MGSSMKDRQNGIIESFQSFFGKEELLAKVIECFPYPIQVYAPDGTSVLVNQAMLAEYHAVSFDVVVGKYNIFKDPYIVASGLLPVLKQAFKGETVFSRMSECLWKKLRSGTAYRISMWRPYIRILRFSLF